MYDHIVHFKFPGQGQRDTPVADLRTLLEKPPAAPPARHRSPAEPAPRLEFFPAKKKFQWSCGGQLPKVSANLPGRAAPARHGGTQLMSRVTNYEAVTERRKSRSGTRSRACRKKTDMPRHKFHANVEASIPSAPGTQLMMSRINTPISVREVCQKQTHYPESRGNFSERNATKDL